MRIINTNKNQMWFTFGRGNETREGNTELQL